MKKEYPQEYRRNLPHIQPQGGMFFITFRLQGSVPIHILKEYKESYINHEGNKTNKSKLELQDNYFLALDEYLDNNENEPYYLANPDIAKLVTESIHYRDGKDYKLVCYIIMSNHVHLIIYNLKKPLSNTDY